MGNKAGGKGKKDPTILTDEDIKTLKLNTQYTEEEIQAWHSGFLKDCPSGKLDKKQFLNVYKVCILLKNNSFQFLVSFFFLLEILSGG
jgi:Ca2+-binding EF-hand superfamily protein